MSDLRDLKRAREWGKEWFAMENKSEDFSEFMDRKQKEHDIPDTFVLAVPIIGGLSILSQTGTKDDHGQTAFENALETTSWQGLKDLFTEEELPWLPGLYYWTGKVEFEETEDHEGYKDCDIIMNGCFYKVAQYMPGHIDHFGFEHLPMTVTEPEPYVVPPRPKNEEEEGVTGEDEID